MYKNLFDLFFTIFIFKPYVIRYSLYYKNYNYTHQIL